MNYPINMTDTDHAAQPVAPAGRTGIRLSPAWRAVAIAAVVLTAAGSFTTLTGLLTEPLVTTKGFGRGDIGLAAALSMVLYGVVAPFGAALMDRYGIRRVALPALGLLVAGAVLTITATPGAAWFVAWWGVLVGIGAGALTMVFGAAVANRWFTDHLGLATGILTSAAVAGQFALLPLVSAVLSRSDWRAPVAICGALAAVAASAAFLGLRNNPRAAGTDAAPAVDAGVSEPQNVLVRMRAVLGRCLRSRRFRLLAAMFFLCGATTNGLMWSHFTPAAHDHGMAATSASSLLAVIGIANILGTIAAGRLTDKRQPRLLLAVFFLVRGGTLALLPLLFTSGISPGLITFAIVFGVLDVATVPPIVALCRQYFGADATVVFGWINVAHQLGAATMAMAAGLLREYDGSYTLVWIIGAVCCLAAAAAAARTPTIGPDRPTLVA